jgi:hypothetical protein
MKYLLLIALFVFVSCDDKKTEEPKVKVIEQKPMQQESTGIVEENDMCICTKDWRPVCGSNGVTYPNACQAGCEKIKEFTEGPCPPKKDKK